MTALTHILRPGDCLVYFSHTLLDYCIEIKTWNRAAHVEGYIGSGMSVASRNGLRVNQYVLRTKGLGVNQYVLRTKGLAYIRRPLYKFDIDKAQGWFKTVQGQKYDWKGLLCFTLAVKQGAKDRMFCSEFLTRWYEHGGLAAMAADYDADKVAPAQFLQSPAFIGV